MQQHLNGDTGPEPDLQDLVVRATDGGKAYFPSRSLRKQQSRRVIRCGRLASQLRQYDRPAKPNHPAQIGR
jgi:hypothetical protein